MAFSALLVYVLLLFIRPQEWVAFMLGWRILDVVAAVAIVAGAGHLMRSEWRLRDAPQNWLMLGLLLAVGMSHVRHTYLAALVDSFREFGKVALIFFLITILADSLRRVHAVIGVVAVGCLFMAVHGILQAHTGAGFGGHEPLVHGEVVRVRAMGFFHDPNDLALMLVAVLPFLLAVASSREYSPLARAGSLAASVPMVYCVYLTNSRGGWLALGVMVLAYCLLGLRNKKLAIAVAALAFAALVAFGPSRMQTISADEGAARGRVIAWGYGNYMLKKWPLFGAGMGRFVEFSPEGLVAHNSFVHCWAELGLFGYFFWLGLLIASLKDTRALARAGREPPEGAPYARLGRASAAGLIGFLAAAFFLSRTYVVPLYILFGLVVATRTLYEREIGPLPGAFRTRDVRWVVVAELVSIPALYVLIRLLN